ncbi:hypothetical protein [Streptomyces filamentosus]|uniref:hypothetical protein n=1 Tax=Streptomyces filamentosus TaxID=67294 RepID=UPI0033E74493
MFASDPGIEGIKVIPVLFFFSFGCLGLLLALNLRNFAEKFFGFMSRFMMGFTGSASANTIRFVGGVMAILSLIGVATELSKPFRS